MGWPASLALTPPRAPCAQAAHGGRLPEPGNEAEAAQVLAHAKAINDAAADKVGGWWWLAGWLAPRGALLGLVQLALGRQGAGAPVLHARQQAAACAPHLAPAPARHTHTHTLTHTDRPPPPPPQVELDEGVLRWLALTARACLNPMAAMFGGVVGQEVVKAASGKFHPLFQVRDGCARLGCASLGCARWGPPTP